MDRGCEPGYDVLAAPLETEFVHHLLEQFVFGPESVVGSDPLRSSPPAQRPADEVPT